MDLFSNQHSPVSDPDVSPLLPIPPHYASRIVKTDLMSIWSYSDPRPYTPQAIDHTNIAINHNDPDSYGSADTLTYLSLSPAEIDASGTAPPFSVTSDLLNYEHKPFWRMDDELFMNHNKDEGYVSPTASLHSLTPPSDLRQLHVRDSANESGNSNDLTGLYDTEDHHQFRLSDSSTPPHPPRTQCVKCGSVVDISHCLKEATGHYLCFSCHMQSNPTLLPVQTPLEESAQKRTRKKQSAIVNARNQICQNCECPNTTLWRRSFSGEAVCNACGLYEKLHKRKRPKSMRKDTIQTRRRKPRNTETKKKVVAETISSVPASNTSTISNRVTPQPMIMPPNPPPPYNNRYITIEDTGSYQVLPPMGSMGFLNTYPYEATYSHFAGQ